MDFWVAWAQSDIYDYDWAVEDLPPLQSTGCKLPVKVESLTAWYQDNSIVYQRKAVTGKYNLSKVTEATVVSKISGCNV